MLLVPYMWASMTILPILHIDSGVTYYDFELSKA